MFKRGIIWRERIEMGTGAEIPGGITALEGIGIYKYIYRS